MSEILAASQYDEWDAFVRQAKGGTIFHYTWYLAHLAPDIRVQVLRDKSGRINAGMILAVTSFLGTKAVRGTALNACNGPLILPSGKQNLVAVASEEKNLMLRLLASCPRLGMYDFTMPSEWRDMMPFLWNGFDATICCTYR
ncbi:hypothetical protein LCGC14_2971270, partial [marine sediment metagenome]